MAVRIDEAGQHQIIGRVDDLGVTCLDPAGDLLDLSVGHQHIAEKLAELVVERDDKAAAQQKSIAAWRFYWLLFRHVHRCIHEPR